MSQREMLATMIEDNDREIERLQKLNQHLRDALQEESGGTVGVALSTAPRKRFMEMAREVIGDKKLNPEQAPLHAERIAELVQQEFKRPTDKKSLSQMLFANATVAKRRKYFYKDKKQPNTYGLIEWQK